MSGGVLGLASFALAAGGWGLWWRRIQAVDVPLRPYGYWAAMGASVVLAVAAFAAGPGWPGGLAAGIGLGLGAMYLGLALISALPDTPMAVAVGRPAPDFTAPDSEGAAFTLSSLRGSPVLLKFFRGHW